MKKTIRPLPATIIVIALLIGAKTVDLAKNLSIGSPAHANTSPPTPAPSTPSPPTPPPAPPAASPPPNRPAPQASNASRPPPPAPNAAPVADCGEPMSEAERTTLQDLRTRRKQLDDRTSGLDEREALLGAAEKRLNERVQQLGILQAKLETLEKERKDREEANWNGLVKTYEAMKPRDAAAIFNDLENGVLIQVLDRMKESKAALILAAMTPERARAATIQLAKYREQLTVAPQVAPPVSPPPSPPPAPPVTGPK